MPKARVPAPKWVRLSGWVLLPGTALIVGRLLYERLVLQGPQMTLFSFAHIHPLLTLGGLLSYMLAHLWFITVILGAIVGLARWELPNNARIVLIGIGILLVTGLLVQLVYASGPS